MWKEFVSPKVGSQEVLLVLDPSLIESLRVERPGNIALPQMKLQCAQL